MPDSIGKSIRKKCVVTVQPTISGALTAVTVGLLGTVADGVSDFLGRSFLLELVSSDLDSSGEEKDTVKAYATYDELDKESKLYKYQCEFEVPDDFGEIGAVLVQNERHRDAYVKNIVLDEIVTFTFGAFDISALQDWYNELCVVRTILKLRFKIIIIEIPRRNHYHLDLLDTPAYNLDELE
nr:linoleate 13S-lipoxygenase 2-1, chloroplastic-like [Tanacetum cinerariifolium]